MSVRVFLIIVFFSFLSFSLEAKITETCFIQDDQNNLFHQIICNKDACSDSLCEKTRTDELEIYLKNFESLAKSEQWKEIISKGLLAMDIAKKLDRVHDEAKICAQLTSSFFYLGDYAEAFKYASFCHELSQKIDDPYLFVRALYLESAVCRALAGKNLEDNSLFIQSVTLAESAAAFFEKNALTDFCLKGKIYFNWGAAHADHPKGDLSQAVNYYLIALDSFQKNNVIDDIIRTKIRLGKAYLLQQKYDNSQIIIDEVRPLITTQRIAMQTDYLEAQLKLAIKDIIAAKKLTIMGLEKAQSLGAKEDFNRFSLLLSKIESAGTIQ